MRIQGLTISEALGDIRSEYLLEAEEAYFVAITQKRRPSRNGWLTRFVNSGWGVAIICALVAVSVMGGIIWAGFRAGDVPPGYNDVITGEVYLTAGGQTVTPEAFFGYSEVHKGNQSAMSCGAGFYGEFTVSPVPTLTYADDLRLHMPKNYTLEAVYVYDPAAPTEAIYTFESVDDLETLTAGSYYVSLRITHTEGKNEYGYDYAFCLAVPPEVELPIMKQPHAWPVFDPPANAFLGKNTGTYPDGGSVANIPLTAAYTQVRMPEGMRWYVMTARYAQGAGDGGLIFLLYDPQNDPSTPYIAIDKQLQFIYPPARTLLQLEDGRIITLHADEDLFSQNASLEVTAHLWMWSKVDPDTGEELEELRLLPLGEAWSYTFDLADSLDASRDWQYAFATYIYGLTNGETPTLRVLLDNLFCETDEVKYDLAQYEHFSEEENLTTGWARLQRMMNGELRPDLWVQPESLHRVAYIEYDADFLLPVAEEAAAHISESALPVYRSNDEKPTGEGCLRFVAIPEETLGYYGYRIERTEQAITLYAASPNGSMEAFVYLAEAFVTGYEDGCYLIFEDKDFLPIGSTIEVRG